MFPFILIPIVFGLATGNAIKAHYCETDAHAQQQALAASAPHTPSGDKLCALVERDRHQFRQR